MRVPEINSLQKKTKLLFADLSSLLLIHRPGELILLEALVPGAEAIGFPVDDFQDSPVLVAEQKQIALEHIHLQLFADDHAQPVDLLAHIEIVARPDSG